jgi:hypothetical protein
LPYVKYRAQLGYAEGILAQYSQDLQAQWIGTGFAQAGDIRQGLIGRRCGIRHGSGLGVWGEHGERV